MRMERNASRDDACVSRKLIKVKTDPARQRTRSRGPVEKGESRAQGYGDAGATGVSVQWRH